MKNRENGSELGVITAEKVTIPTIIQRRMLRSWRVFTALTSNKKTRSTGNSNATPSATW